MVGSMTKATAAELLQLVIDQAPKLREVGVSSVELEGVKFALRPLEPAAAPTRDDNEEDAERRDPLHDPDTFGGRRVPGNTRRERT